MGARFVQDSRNRTHYVWHQEMAMSCGPACIAMTEQAYYQKNIENAETRVRDLSQKYPGNFNVRSGTTIENLATVLRAEGIPTYKPVQLKKADLFSYFRHYVRPRTPVICQLLWLQPESVTMMTHFVLLKQVDPDSRMIFLDPLNDVVEVSYDQLVKERVNYRANGGYNGQLTGWIVVPHLNGNGNGNGGSGA